MYPLLGIVSDYPLFSFLLVPPLLSLGFILPPFSLSGCFEALVPFWSLLSSSVLWLEGMERTWLPGVPNSGTDIRQLIAVGFLYEGILH